MVNAKKLGMKKVKKLKRIIACLALVTIPGFATQMYAQTYNVSYNAINFGGDGVTITEKVGTGTELNDIVLYQNVINVDGQQIDAIVRTQELFNITFSAYDQEGTDPSYSNNQPSYFAPQFTIGSGGGYAVFKIQFILGGSYNNTSNTGTLVTLQNVYLNTYDIDGSDITGTNQYNEFVGFGSAELSSATNIDIAYNSTFGLTKFESISSYNTLDAADLKNRVRMTYDYLTEFTTRVGAEGNSEAYFFLDFSSGDTFTTAVSYSAPSLDLNTETSGINNEAVMIAPASKNFSSGTTNLAFTGSRLENLKIVFTSAQIYDGTSESLIVSGATSGGTIGLDFSNGQAIPNVVFGGVTYAVSATVSNGISTLLFTKSGGGKLTLLQVESLIDAFQYQNSLSPATKGWRYFNTTTMTTSFEAAVARFGVYIDTPLPTDLTFFVVECEKDYPVLKWQTASEHNSAFFAVEQSQDGTEWEEISEIVSAGNTTETMNYTFEDYTAIRFNGYYRLRQIDNDGVEKLYDPIHASCIETDEIISVYPNPTAGDFNVELNALTIGSATITIVNTTNEVLHSKSIDVVKGINQILFSGMDLSRGMYYLNVNWNGQSFIKKVSVF
jgi:hypothetical protein